LATVTTEVLFFAMTPMNIMITPIIVAAIIAFIDYFKSKNSKFKPMLRISIGPFSPDGLARLNNLPHYHTGNTLRQLQ
jgi:hypothetical protein